MLHVYCIQLQTNPFRTLLAFDFQQFTDTSTRECKNLDWVLRNRHSAFPSHVVLDPSSNLNHDHIFTEFNFSLQC